MLKSGKHKIFIIGLGQIGGSLGFDLNSGGFASEIIGYDISSSVCTSARRKGAVNRIVRTIEKGISQSDIVILATPIRRTISLLPKVCRLAGGNKIIIDVAGTKTQIFNKLSKITRTLNYFSCHPMTGTEKAGFDGAQKGLFKNVEFVIIPYVKVKPENHKIVAGLVRSIGARPLSMSSSDHDINIALTSHLPYALAVSLCLLTEKLTQKNVHLMRLLGGSFKSSSRVALSSPELTRDMFLTNSKNISNALAIFIKHLKALERLILKSDVSKLDDAISRAKIFAEKVHHG